MTFLISLALTALFIAVGRNALKKRPNRFYAAAALLSAALVLCTISGASAFFPAWFRVWLWPVLSNASLAAALFAVVMYTGALPNGSPLMKVLMPIRGELSILASILTLGHNLSYGRTYFRLLFTQPGRLPAYQAAAAVLSLLMLCILLPLWVTSFPRVRRKMKARNWKRLQRLAYAFYAMLYCHVMLLNLPRMLQGDRSCLLTVLVYSVVFLSYGVCRIQKAVLIHSRKSGKVTGKRQLAALAAVCAVAAAAVFGADRFGANVASASAAALPAETASAGLPAERPAETSAPAEPAAPVGTDAPAEPAAPAETQPPTQTEAPMETEAPEPPSASPAAAAGSEAPAEPQPEPDETAPTPTAEPVPVSKYRDGSYTGSGQGFEGTITVSVAISGDRITDITVTSAVDDAPFLDDAIAGMIPAMLAAQSADVDAVSGATFSSQGIRSAVQNALASALN